MVINMATILLKRGLAASLPAALAGCSEGEPVITTDSKKLYVKIGNEFVPINADTPSGSTMVVGVVKLNNATNSTDETTAATPKAVKAAYDLAATKAGTAVATTAVNGLMASADKVKLDGITKGAAAGNVPVLDSTGKLPEAVIPAVAITDTYVVNTQAAMLALVAQRGDVAVRSDLSETYILKTTPASTLANWVKLPNPTGAVTSVAGRTGAVVLTKADVGLSNVANETKAQLLTNAALAGVPTAPTAAAATSNTQLATTAFVKAQGYITANSTIDGGTF